MLNKKDIISILDKYNLDNKKYVVISSAAMVLYGIKESTKDIDIAVTKEYYQYLLNNYNCTYERTNELGNKVYFIDDIINFGIDYYTDYEIINNIQVQTIDEIIKLKKELNRPKDIKDIKLIEKKMRL
ncbi:MAG: hypothetical protein IJ574_00495 [Bacilli bacterium]|nr:hypothetical protein [Bacilli bacterium]